MAVVVPVIASLAAAGSAVAAAGSLAAAMATVGGFLTVAGAALTTIGAITGKEDVMKVGGFMSLAGGLGSAMNSANAASSTADPTLTGSSTLTSGGGETIGQSMGGGLEGTAQTLEPVSGAAGMEQVIQEAGNAAAGTSTATPAFDYRSVMGADALGTNAAGYADAAQAAGQSAAETYATTPTEMSLMERAGATAAQPQQESILGKFMQRNSPSFDFSQPVGQATDPLQAGASRLTQDSLGSLLEKGVSKVNQIGQWVDKNKELVKIGGSMLESMYGPNAERMDLEKSILARRWQNMNSPVALKFGSGRL